MARKGFSGLTWDLSACRATFYDKDDVLRAQPDALGDDPQVEACELHAPFGTLARPPDAALGPNGRAIENQMCGLLTATDGDEHHAWLVGDPRVIEKLPLLKHGERLDYGFAGQFIRYHADGKISLYTTHDGTTNGRTISFQLRRDGYRWEFPYGRMHFDNQGFRVRTGGGAAIAMGSISGLPAPLDALGLKTFLRLSADMIEIEAKVIAEGTPATAGVPSEPVAKATSLLALATAVQGALTAIGAALTALGNGSAAAAITASATALAAATTAVPAKSKMVT